MHHKMRKTALLIYTSLGFITLLLFTIPLTLFLLQERNTTQANAAPANFIYRDGTKLMLNGQQYKFAGFNADTWFGCWPNEVPTDAQLDKYFSELNPRSMTRIWPLPGTDLAIMDRIVAAAERHNQYLAPSLMDGNADCGQPAPNFGNPSRELAWIDQIVPRYKNSKAIGFWEIINEPNGENSNLKNYYKAISDRIRSHDPNHLIASGSHAAWSGGEAKYIADHDLPNIDLISVHEYDAATGVSHWGEVATRASKALNKPWYAGEDGFCCGGGDTGSDTGNAEKLKAEWAAYLAVPECAGMLYWDFKLGHQDRTTVNFNNALWTAGKTFRHAYQGTTNTQPTTPATRITFTVFLHGVGKGGDNVNPNATGNMNPLTKQRPLTIGLFNAQNTLVFTKVIQGTYNEATGNFTGSTDAANLSSGSYSVVVRTDKYLQRTIPGIHNITSGQEKQFPTISLIAGDIVIDNRINILDYNAIMGCFSDLTPAKSCTTQQKSLSDLTDDGAVNQFDYSLFIRELTNIQGQ
jgi:hypothetical protein